MPGSFPAAINVEGSASASVDQNSLENFAKKEYVGSKTRAQRNLVAQLDTLVFFLVGYQFIKYCHSACILPVLAHVAVQMMASVDSITNPSNLVSGMLLVTEVINRQHREATAAGQPSSRTHLANAVLTKTCLVIYWKYIFVVVYHTLFMVTWMQEIAKTGQLHRLQNGSWWVISFIGEDVPSHYSQDSSFWVRFYQLGLPELLLTDTIILAIQLVLFQCVFVQSTVSPKGIALDEDEIYILRAHNGRGDVGELKEGVPDILHVKLYEVFRKEAFVP